MSPSTPPFRPEVEFEALSRSRMVEASSAVTKSPVIEASVGVVVSVGVIVTVVAIAAIILTTVLVKKRTAASSKSRLIHINQCLT